jgi:hypothetical protein
MGSPPTIDYTGRYTAPGGYGPVLPMAGLVGGFGGALEPYLRWLATTLKAVTGDPERLCGRHTGGVWPPHTWRQTETDSSAVLGFSSRASAGSLPSLPWRAGPGMPRPPSAMVWAWRRPG